MTVSADWARSVGDAVKSLPRSIPPGTGPYVVRSLRAMRRVRTPRQAVTVFEAETEKLLSAVMPRMVAHPLPVRTIPAAKALVAAAGGIAAAGQEVEELGVLLSGGAALPPALPLMLATSLLAIVVEAAVAASLRVHDLEAAGIKPDPTLVSRDVIIAMTGASDAEVRAGGSTVATNQMVKKIAARMLARWSRALVPFVGIAYSSWDAQRTIDAIRARALPEPVLVP